MALKKSLAQRLFNAYHNKTTSFSRLTSATRPGSDKLAPDPGDKGVFRRFLHRRPVATSPELRQLPSTTTNLVERLKEMDFVRSRINFDGLLPPPPAPAAETAEESPENSPEKFTVADVRKVLRVSQLEMVKMRLRRIERDCISYSEFVKVVEEFCSCSDDVAALAKILDDSGTVIVLGNVVFVHPDEVVKTLQSLLPMPLKNTTTTTTNDPQMLEELKQMEEEKSAIDKKAESLVRRELWCGLGYFVIQTAAFMRLTFWELSWDVMEPICFYVTSVYCMAGYAFFLRTSKEPSFEGFFQSRFASKQKRLMEKRMFDLKRFNELKRACYPQLPSPLDGNKIDFAHSHEHFTK